MKKMYFLLLLLCSNFSIAGAMNETEVDVFVQNFMSSIVKEDFKSAFDAAEKHSFIEKSRLLTSLRSKDSQKGQLNKLKGSSVDYEIFERKKLGRSIIRYSALEKGQKIPLLWVFYFYKNEDGWILTHFTWNVEIQTFFN